MRRVCMHARVFALRPARACNISVCCGQGLGASCAQQAQQAAVYLQHAHGGTALLRVCTRVCVCVCCGLGAQIVPHIPPTLCNLYQHGGDLLYLQVIRVQCCSACGAHVRWATISTLHCCVRVCVGDSGPYTPAKASASPAPMPRPTAPTPVAQCVCCAVLLSSGVSTAGLHRAYSRQYGRTKHTSTVGPNSPRVLAHMLPVHAMQMTPGSIKFLTEQPMFFITGIWSSSLVKLLHYSKVLLGWQPWKGRGER